MLFILFNWLNDPASAILLLEPIDTKLPSSFQDGCYKSASAPRADSSLGESQRGLSTLFHYARKDTGSHIFEDMLRVIYPRKDVLQFCYSIQTSPRRLLFVVIDLHCVQEKLPALHADNNAERFLREELEHGFGLLKHQFLCCFLPLHQLKLLSKNTSINLSFAFMRTRQCFACCPVSACKTRTLRKRIKFSG